MADTRSVMEAVAAIARHERAIVKLKEIPGVHEAIEFIDAQEAKPLKIVETKK